MRQFNGVIYLFTKQTFLKVFGNQHYATKGVHRALSATEPRTFLYTFTKLQYIVF